MFSKKLSKINLCLLHQLILNMKIQNCLQHIIILIWNKRVGIRKKMVRGRVTWWRSEKWLRDFKIQNCVNLFRRNSKLCKLFQIVWTNLVNMVFILFRQNNFTTLRHSHKQSRTTVRHFVTSKTWQRSWQLNHEPFKIQIIIHPLQTKPLQIKPTN